MRVAFGLGNPGPEYATTRHNAGFLLADSLVANWEFPRFRSQSLSQVSRGTIGRRSVLIVKPQTYVNRSGDALSPFLTSPRFDAGRDLLVLVDDIALPMGSFRLRARGSDGGHNGLKSVAAALGTQEYARLRIGVGPLPEGADQPTYLLSPFEPAELDALADLVPDLTDAVECWVRQGIEEAMNRFNRRARREE